MKNGESEARRATMLHLRELLTVATTVTTFAACQSEEPPPATAATPPPAPTGQVFDATAGVVDAGLPALDVVDAGDQDATVDAALDASTDAPTDAKPHKKRDAGVAKPLPPPHGYQVVDMLPPPARRPPRSKP